MGTLVITAIAAMLLLAIGVIFFVIMYQRRVILHQQDIRRINEQKQLELIQASIRGEEEERMRIASELHDDVGATLSSVRLYLHAAARQPDSEIISRSRVLLDETIGKVRNISHALQPALLQQLGLQASVSSFVSMVGRGSSLVISYIPTSEIPRLPEPVELCVYRILQELINNVIKHASAQNVWINISFSAGTLAASVTHDGLGITQADFDTLLYKAGAIGLKNIVNRLKSVSGQIEFSREENCYCVTIIIPTYEDGDSQNQIRSSR